MTDSARDKKEVYGPNFDIRVAINKDRAILNTIQRQLDRIEGKEVYYLRWHAGIPLDAHPHVLSGFRKAMLRDLKEKRDEAARIRAELPWTPCRALAEFKRAKRRKARRRRKRNKRTGRKSRYS